MHRDHRTCSRPGCAIWAGTSTMRVIVYRRRLFDHEQPTLFDTNGYPYSCFVTNTPATGRHGLGVQYVDARHRVHARVEDDVRTTQDTGLGRLPSKSWTVNKAWCAAVRIAVDLIAWLCLYPLTGALAKAEPKTLGYRLFHTPPGWSTPAATGGAGCPKRGPGPPIWPLRSTPSAVCRCLPLDRDVPVPAIRRTQEATPADATVGYSSHPTRHTHLRQTMSASCDHPRSSPRRISGNVRCPFLFIGEPLRIDVAVVC